MKFQSKTLQFIIIVGTIIFIVVPQAHASSRATPLLVNHQAVLEFNQILANPSAYTTFFNAIEQAKSTAVFHYAHTSHGGQIVSGLSVVDDLTVSGTGPGNPTPFKFLHISRNIVTIPVQESPIGLRIYDGNPPETYIEPQDYWSTDEGTTRTRAVLSNAYNGIRFNYSMWSWCGQQSSNSVATVNLYNTQLSSFDAEYPNVTFIYMTGHTDGTQDNTNSTLRRNNQMVRDYASTNNKVVYDFADIESWDPAGNYYPNTSDNCAWCDTWCTNHPSECASLPGCAHSHGYNCIQKAKAYWWMMARLSGWPGVGTTTPPISPTRTPTPQPPTSTPTRVPTSSIEPTPSRTPTPRPPTSTPTSILPTITPLPGTILGDVNGDSCVNFIDLYLVIVRWLAHGSGMKADVNADGTVNFMDLRMVRNNYGQGCIAGR